MTKYNYDSHADRINSEILDTEAEAIMQKLKNSTIYGIRLNPDNPSHVLVGAYYLGRLDGMNREDSVIRELLELI